MSKSKSHDKGKMSEVDGQIQKMYEIKKRLGKGAYGIVWKAVNKKTNQTVAVKKIFDAFRNETDAQRTFREIMFLRAFRNHDNIIQLYSIHRAANHLDIYLSFEFMESDLHEIIKRGKILKEIHKRYIMYQLLNAIKYIHSGNVIHRDLKPSNILIDSRCKCKIADFGLARSVSHWPTNDSDHGDPIEPILTDYVATRWYRAPEILVASKNYTKGIDMWSLGCILAEMIRGKPLFPGSCTVNQIERIIAALPEITENDIKSVGAGFGTALLNQNSCNNNIKLDDLMQSCSEDAKSLVKSLLVLDPTQRLTAKQALEHLYVAKFRRVLPEPELDADIIPPFRDDVQLTVQEYRSKLYELITISEKNGFFDKLTNGNMINSKKRAETINIEPPHHTNSSNNKTVISKNKINSTIKSSTTNFSGLLNNKINSNIKSPKNDGSVIENKSKVKSDKKDFVNNTNYQKFSNVCEKIKNDNILLTGPASLNNSLCSSNSKVSNNEKNVLSKKYTSYDRKTSKNNVNSLSSISTMYTDKNNSRLYSDLSKSQSNLSSLNGNLYGNMNHNDSGKDNSDIRLLRRGSVDSGTSSGFYMPDNLSKNNESYNSQHRHHHHHHHKHTNSCGNQIYTNTKIINSHSGDSNYFSSANSNNRSNIFTDYSTKINKKPTLKNCRHSSLDEKSTKLIGSSINENNSIITTKSPELKSNKKYSQQYQSSDEKSSNSDQFMSNDSIQSNYYENRLKNLEEKINKHKMDMKSFLIQNPKFKSSSSSMVSKDKPLNTTTINSDSNYRLSEKNRKLEIIRTKNDNNNKSYKNSNILNRKFSYTISEDNDNNAKNCQYNSMKSKQGNTSYGVISAGDLLKLRSSEMIS